MNHQAKPGTKARAGPRARKREITPVDLALSGGRAYRSKNSTLRTSADEQVDERCSCGSGPCRRVGCCGMLPAANTASGLNQGSDAAPARALYRPGLAGSKRRRYDAGQVSEIRGGT